MAHRADTPDDDLPPRVRHGRARDRRQRLVIAGVAAATALGILAIAACGGLAWWFASGRDVAIEAASADKIDRETARRDLDYLEVYKIIIDVNAMAGAHSAWSEAAAAAPRGEQHDYDEVARAFLARSKQNVEEAIPTRRKAFVEKHNVSETEWKADFGRRHPKALVTLDEIRIDAKRAAKEQAAGASTFFQSVAALPKNEAAIAKQRRRDEWVKAISEMAVNHPSTVAFLRNAQDSATR